MNTKFTEQLNTLLEKHNFCWDADKLYSLQSQLEDDELTGTGLFKDTPSDMEYKYYTTMLGAIRERILNLHGRFEECCQAFIEALSLIDNMEQVNKIVEDFETATKERQPEYRLTELYKTYKEKFDTEVTRKKLSLTVKI